MDLLHSGTRPLTEINEGLDDLAAGRVVRRLFQAWRLEELVITELVDVTE